MRPILRFASALLLCASCLGDDIPERQGGPPDEAGVSFIDAGDEDDGGAGPTTGCPANEPKMGLSCTGEVTESDSCEYEVSTCVGSDGRELKETVVYCCPNGYWGICGGRSPCDDQPDAAVSEDAPSRRDAGADANGDGGLDGGIDTTIP